MAGYYGVCAVIDRLNALGNSCSNVLIGLEVQHLRLTVVIDSYFITIE